MGNPPEATPFDPQVLRERLAALTADLDPQRWLVAFSGGVDSTALIHALCEAGTGLPIVAVHVDHGIHPDSAAWANHCEAIATSLGATFIGRRVDVPTRTDAGPEAAARQARYAVFLSLTESGDCLLSAHHEDDQAETLLLNLMRGSGPAGLAGIGTRQAFGRGHLLRPLIGIDGAELRAYAMSAGVSWIDDPSNDDTRFDRNFLRREVLPRLAERWPAVANRLRRSAELLGEASGLLDDLANLDFERCGTPPVLDTAPVERLSAPRQRNLLRRAIRSCGLPPPPSTALHRIVDELIPAREDASPLVAWPGAEVRRYRGALYFLPELAGRPAVPAEALSPGAAAVSLGQGLGKLSLSDSGQAGIDPAIAAGGLVVRYRQGGEALRPVSGGPTKKLKGLLQDAAVLPWMRDRVPLLYSDERLVAVADLWVAAECARDPGLTVTWTGKPPITGRED
jgi:tRNA(Ile)-lysidine synthase